MPKKKIKVFIFESEAGWGQRLDEVKEFDSEEEADKYVEKFNKPNNKPVTSAWYMFAIREDRQIRR